MIKTILYLSRKFINKATELQVYLSEPHVSAFFGLHIAVLSPTVIFAMYCNLLWIELDLKINRRVDHAGLYFNLTLFGFCIDYSLYDMRHWDVDNNKWEVYA